MSLQMNGSSVASGTSSPLRIYDARSTGFPGPTSQADDYDKVKKSQGSGLTLVIDNGISYIFKGLMKDPVSYALDGRMKKNRG